MKKSLVKIIAFLTVISILLSLTVVFASASSITTTPTEYSSADEVNYKTSSGYIANWGARGEVATFLSSYAEDFYTGSYVYEMMSNLRGGTSTSNAPSSELYKSLQALMKSKHTHQTSYQETRQQYRYTDCVSNNTSNISSFYSGKKLSGSWDGGSTWNREHTWPNSKGLGGNDENDIMMLRPTSVSENSSRGNTAYGEGSSYFDPGESVRGDCARIVLYVYVRWGNTGRMWGTSGVMESLNVLLRWMEEDPVDTWEMGRNDAVQSITGTRNVFVDYPEYAWLLFGKEVPDDLRSPSGAGENICNHTSTNLVGKTDATCTQNGYSGDTVCTLCQKTLATGSVILASHSYTSSTVILEPTCTEAGLERATCTVCNDVVEASINPLGHSVQSTVILEPTCTEAGLERAVCTVCNNAVETSISALGHSLISHEAKAPTESEVGWEAYETCSRCDYTTYTEIDKLFDATEFKASIDAIDTEADLDELYGMINGAKAIYAQMSEAERDAASEEVGALELIIEEYNYRASASNEAHKQATQTAFAQIIDKFSFLSEFWALLKESIKEWVN